MNVKDIPFSPPKKKSPLYERLLCTSQNKKLSYSGDSIYNSVPAEKKLTVLRIFHTTYGKSMRTPRGMSPCLISRFIIYRTATLVFIISVISGR